MDEHIGADVRRKAEQAKARGWVTAPVPAGQEWLAERLDAQTKALTEIRSAVTLLAAVVVGICILFLAGVVLSELAQSG